MVHLMTARDQTYQLLAMDKLALQLVPFCPLQSIVVETSDVQNALSDGKLVFTCMEYHFL